MAARGDAMEGDLAWAVSSLPILPSSGLSFLRTRSTASAPPQPQARNTCGSWLKASEVFLASFRFYVDGCRTQARQGADC